MIKTEINITTTTTKASIGKKIANELKVISVPVSAVDTTGLPITPVLTEEAKRVVLVIPCLTVTVPPPAIMAKPKLTWNLDE